MISSQKYKYEPTPIQIFVFILGVVLFLAPGIISFFNIHLSSRIFGINNSLVNSRMGEFQMVSMDVRRKTESETAFTTTRPGDAVFMGDSVATGKNSKATITLDEGSVIEVAPESLIKIMFMDRFSLGGLDRIAQVQIQKGTVDVQATQGKLEIKETKSNVIKEVAPKENITLPPRIAFFKPEQALIQEAPQTTNTVTTTTTAKSDESEQNQAQASLAPALPPLPTTWNGNPLPKQNLVQEAVPPAKTEEAPVSAKTEPSAAPTIEPPSTAESTAIATPAEVPASTPAPTATPMSAAPNTSAPILSFPPNKMVATKDIYKGSQRRVLVTWKRSKTCPLYEVKVSKNSNLSSPLLSEKTKINFHSLIAPDEGKYFWNVSCVYSDGSRRTSGTHEFTLPSVE